MVNLIIAIAMMTVSAYIGMQIKKFYKMRVSLSEDIICLLRTIKSEIGTRRTKKEDILANYPYKIEETKEMVAKRNHASIYFDEEYNRYVDNYFGDLGKSNLDEELKKCDRAIDYIEERRNTYKIEVSKKGELFFKIAVLIGVAIGIMIV